MKLNIPWLSKRRARDGRVGLSVGPAGISIAWVDAEGQLGYCQHIESFDDRDELLEGLVAEQKWQGMPCSLVLHPSYYQILLAETPPVQKDEIASALRWRVKDLLDFPVDDAAIDYFLIPPDAYRGQKKMLYAAAMRKEGLQKLVDSIADSGLDVDCVEVAELALHNLASRRVTGGGGLAVIHLSDGEGFINLVEEGAIYLSRSLDVGIEHFTTLMGDPTSLDALLLEVQRSLDFYESQLGKGIITTLAFSPVIEAMKPVEQHLSAQLGLNVEPLAVGPLINSVADIDSDQLSRCVLAIGAALGPGTASSLSEENSVENPEGSPEVSNAAH